MHLPFSLVLTAIATTFTVPLLCLRIWMMARGWLRSPEIKIGTWHSEIRNPCMPFKSNLGKRIPATKNREKIRDSQRQRVEKEKPNCYFLPTSVVGGQRAKLRRKLLQERKFSRVSAEAAQRLWGFPQPHSNPTSPATEQKKDMTGRDGAIRKRSKSKKSSAPANTIPGNPIKFTGKTDRK